MMREETEEEEEEKEEEEKKDEKENEEEKEEATRRPQCAHKAGEATDTCDTACGDERDATTRRDAAAREYCFAVQAIRRQVATR